MVRLDKMIVDDLVPGKIFDRSRFICVCEAWPASPSIFRWLHVKPALIVALIRDEKIFDIARALIVTVDYVGYVSIYEHR